MTATITQRPRAERETFAGMRLTATEHRDGWRIRVRSAASGLALWNPERAYTTAAAALAAGRAFVRAGLERLAAELAR